MTLKLEGIQKLYGKTGERCDFENCPFRSLKDATKYRPWTGLTVSNQMILDRIGKGSDQRESISPKLRRDYFGEILLEHFRSRVNGTISPDNN